MKRRSEQQKGLMGRDLIAFKDEAHWNAVHQYRFAVFRQFWECLLVCLNLQFQLCLKEST